MRRPGIGGAISGALSGFLAALAFPPFGLWPLLFVAFLPLLHRLSLPGLESREATLEGVAFGALFFGLLLHWIPPTLEGMIPFGAVYGIFSILLLTAVTGVQVTLLHDLVAHRKISPVLALPAVWAGGEYLLAHAGPWAFPWTPLALAFAEVPPIAGISELAGIQGVTLWVTVVNGVLATAWTGGGSHRVERAVRGGEGVDETGLGTWIRGHIRSAVPILICVALLLPPIAWGVNRIRTLETTPLPEIFVAQLAVPRAQLIDREVRDQAVRTAFDRILESRVEGPRPLFILFPEAPFGTPFNEVLEGTLSEYVEAIGVPMIVGAQMGVRTDSQMDGGTARLRNVALMIESGAPARVVHTKSRLVPVVESGGGQAGPPGGVLSVGNPEGGVLRSGVLICFEAAFPSEGRRLRRAGADLLLNPTNDGWFRSLVGGTSRAALAQHRAHLVLRSVESRMGAVRSSVGGELLVVDPTGQVADSRAAGEEGLVLVTPRSSPVETGFVRFGNLAGSGSVLLLLLLLLGGLLGKREQSVAKVM